MELQHVAVQCFGNLASGVQMHIAYGFRIVFEHDETIMIHAGELGQLF